MGRDVHFEIRCEDFDRAERFYTKVFGWQISSWEGAPVDNRLITTGPDDQVGINVALAQRRGGQTIVDPGGIPNVSTVAYYKDAEGKITWPLA